MDDFRSYEFVNSLYEYQQMFEKHMNLLIHYKIFKNAEISFNKENCIKVKKNTYCVSSQNSPKIKGLFKETMR